MGQEDWDYQMIDPPECPHCGEIWGGSGLCPLCDEIGLEED